MKTAVSSPWLKICIWFVVLLTALPPSLMAQTIGTPPGFPIPGAGIPPGLTREMVQGAQADRSPTAHASADALPDTSGENAGYCPDRTDAQ